MLSQRVSVLLVATCVALGCRDQTDVPAAPTTPAAPRLSVDALPGGILPGLTGHQKNDFEAGRLVFERVFTPETGLGPLFNGNSCAQCHRNPAAGGNGGALAIEVHATSWDGGACYMLDDLGGPVYQKRVTPLLAAYGYELEEVPAEASAVALRTTPDVFGFGLLDAVPDEAILALADPDDADGDGISGRVHWTADGRVGRFGRKADVASLDAFNTGAFQAEQGITVPTIPFEGTIAGQPMPDGVDPVTDEPELDAESLALSNAFVRFLAPPEPMKLTVDTKNGLDGERVFQEIGCVSCHVPELRTGKHELKALSNRKVAAYTDLLLHDMGPELADICFNDAHPSEFRTEPLMGLRHVRLLLHDGRASTIEDAILWHGGEASAARDAFLGLSQESRDALLVFLGSL